MLNEAERHTINRRELLRRAATLGGGATAGTVLSTSAETSTTMAAKSSPQDGRSTLIIASDSKAVVESTSGRPRMGAG